MQIAAEKHIITYMLNYFFIVAYMGGAYIHMFTFPYSNNTAFTWIPNGNKSDSKHKD